MPGKLFSDLGRSPDARYLAQCQDLPSSLVFIMGCHRSGTSLLYHLLARSGELDYLSAYDVIHYQELLHNRITGREASARAGLQAALQTEPNRGLDELPVGVDAPEEYRFVLPRVGPRLFLNALQRIDGLFFQPHLTPRTLGGFLEMCRKKRFLARADRTLVLKNPSDHYFNFRQVHAMLPRARFIFIHRHPLPMLNSYLHGFRGILDRPSRYAALLDRRYASLFRGFQLRRKLFQRVFRSDAACQLLARRLAESFRYYLDNVPQIPAEQWVSIRYEDLCADPVSCLSRIGRHLRLQVSPRIPPGFLAPRNLPVPEGVRRHYADRLDEMRPYLEHCGYAFWPEPANLAAHGAGSR